MSRRELLGFAFVLVAAAPARAQEIPEKLLSPNTQLYVRWDGVTAHKEAYQASIWGPIMAGPTASQSAPSRTTTTKSEPSTKTPS